MVICYITTFVLGLPWITSTTMPNHAMQLSLLHPTVYSILVCHKFS
jgi:hypothetical protein